MQHFMVSKLFFIETFLFIIHLRFRFRLQFRFIQNSKPVSDTPWYHPRLIWKSILNISDFTIVNIDGLYNSSNRQVLQERKIFLKISILQIVTPKNVPLNPSMVHGNIHKLFYSMLSRESSPYELIYFRLFVTIAKKRNLQFSNIFT